MSKIYDFIIIGGGVVGSTIAYGLSKSSNKSIALLDGYDTTYRASVGNYGLTWLQNKGYNQPEFARTCEKAAVSWPKFKEELEKESNIDLEYFQTGGLTFCETKEDFDKLSKKVETINTYYKDEKSFTQMLEHDDLKKIYPGLGENIYGASYNKVDGLLNPLSLVKALLHISQKQGVDSFSNFYTEDIKKEDSIYTIKAKDGRVFKAKQLVLAAGLSNKELGEKLKLNIPLNPQKGHILVVQKTEQLDIVPSFQIRQTKDGTILLGVSNEFKGYDVSIDDDVVNSILKKAMRILPKIKDLKVIRSWASLRIMPEDNEPIYETINKTLHVITTHSAISLAPIHATDLCEAILNGKMPEELKEFSLERFNKGLSNE